MSKQNGKFERTEKKYILTDEQYNAFLKSVKNKIEADEYGLHTISNIYYDTDNYELIRQSIEKPKYKEKFRVRGYGDISSDSTVFLELKKKVKGIVYKRRVDMTDKQAKRFLKNGVLPDKDNQILKEINYFMTYYQPVPKVYLAYDRTAYVGIEDPNLRITIDQNIRSREDDLDLTQGDRGKVLKNPSYLMEIKVDLAYPLWLARILSELRIYPVSFSKYGTVYKDFIMHDLLSEESEEDTCLQAFLAV